MVSNIGGYIADPLSRKDIRNLANKTRELFGLKNEICFPIVKVLELMTYIGIFNLEICKKEDMGTKLGETIPSKKLIKIREDVYDGACAKNSFDEATCAHELGHWIIGHSEQTVSFCRRKEDIYKRRVYEYPEWQANCFSGELFVPKHLVNGMTVHEVMEKCNVTYSMAEYQLEKYNEEGWEE